LPERNAIFNQRKGIFKNVYDDESGLKNYANRNKKNENYVNKNKHELQK